MGLKHGLQAARRAFDGLVDLNRLQRPLTLRTKQRPCHAPRRGQDLGTGQPLGAQAPQIARVRLAAFHPDDLPLLDMQAHAAANAAIGANRVNLPGKHGRFHQDSASQTSPASTLTLKRAQVPVSGATA